MHASHQRSVSISSPVHQAFPSPAPRPNQPQRAHRPSLSLTMSRLKDSLRERIHENPYVHSHRRAASQEQGSRRPNGGPYSHGDVVISDPQLTGSADSLVPSTRLAPLGSGAIVVSTVQEVLALSTQKGSMPPPSSASSRMYQYQKYHPEPVEEEADVDADYSSNSPPLPPLPLSVPTSPRQQSRSSQREWEASRRSMESSSSKAGSSYGLAPVFPDSPRNSGGSRGRRGSPLAQSSPRAFVHQETAPEDEPEVPEVRGRTSFGAQSESQPQRESGPSSSRPESDASFMTGSRNRESENDCFTGAPQLPIDLASALPQPPFEPVLMSNLPANMHKTDPRKLIIVLETSGAMLKSTLSTLTARPSCLATYLIDLVASTNAEGGSFSQAQTPSEEVAEGVSPHSQRSEFLESDYDDESYAGFDSLFQNHLATAGIINPRRPKRRADSTSVIHLFLDRPDAPYQHIMTYLRAPVLPSNSAGMLPYAARLFPAARHSFATARLEALLDLRDEAAYLGLDDLQQLCDNELAGQVPLATPTAEADTQQGSENDTERRSAHSAHTLCEPALDGVKETEKAGSPPHTIDIPIVLPVHEPRSAPVRAGKTYSSDSTSSDASRRERRVGQLDLTASITSQLRQQSRERDRAKPLGNYF
ncbi:hypothetical protein M0805_005468 [Coniferiporia weirii]|nr:hypothetical protein M0805_005468 [Coniferiporia weirii]